MFLFFLKQKTAYEVRSGDGSPDVGSSDLTPEDGEPVELPLFRSTRFGGDQDRPIRKSNGQWTYFGADLAYHYQKAEGADALIDIWGADHAGTVKRIVAAVQALTGGRTRFDVKLVQMVRLLRNRSEEHTSELQSLMRISYAVFGLKKKKKNDKQQ